MFDNTQDSKARSIFVTGLRNIHAVEMQAVELMTRQAMRIENYPDVKARLNRHLDETHLQILRLEQLLEDLDATRSILKDNALAFMGDIAVLTHAMTRDEILKNALANVAFESFEVAAYTSLIQIARSTGFEDAISPLQDSLSEEQSMLQWLDQNLVGVTSRYVQRELAGDKAGI